MALDPGTVDVWDALRARLQPDATLISLTGAQSTGTARVAWGWWADTEEESDYPRVSVHTAGDLPDGAITDGLVQIDAWTWPDGANGGLELLRRIDQRIKDLLHEQRWDHNGVRYYTRASAGNDDPSPAGSPLHYTRDYLITAYSLS